MNTRVVSSKLAFLVAVVFTFPVITQAGKLEMTIDTVPSGARVEMNGNSLGNTPLRVEHPSRYFSQPKSIFARYLSAPIVMTFYLDGYNPRTLDITQGPNLWRSLDGSNQFYYYLLDREYSIYLDPVASYPQTSAGRPSAPNIGYGTAFHSVSPGHFVTNYHVIEEGQIIQVSRDDGTCSANVVASDKANDLAILKIQDDCLPKLRLGRPFQFSNTSNAATGQDVITFGYPLPTEFAAEPQVSKGIIKSTMGFDGDARTLTISNSIQPGNSGGPLFGPDGNVIAIVTATANVNYLYPRYDAIPQDLNFAVKAAYAGLLFQLNGISAHVDAPQESSDSTSSPVDDLPSFVAAVEGNVVLVTSMSGELP